nr:coiled-coil domain-containing protein 90B, mitochondrial-like isoform X2 [Nicotiana tomentosiformis]
MAAAVKRVIPLGVNYGINLSKLRGNYNVSNFPAASLLVNRSQYCTDGYNVKFYGSRSSKSFAHNKFDYRKMSQLVKANGKRAFLVDTLALVKSLEAQGVPSKQAEAITSAITEVLNDSLENIASSFVSLAEMQKSDLVQEANLSKFKSQIQSSQENHFSLLQHETEKLRNDIEKVRSELRYEIDKLTAGQRLDLNLERGSIRDELAKQNAETTNLTNKLDRNRLSQSYGLIETTILRSEDIYVRSGRGPKKGASGFELQVRSRISSVSLSGP